MHPRVRQLYKELIFTSQLYNAWPLEKCREKIKTQFFKSKNLEVGSEEWKKALAWGKHEVKQMKALHEIRVYRRMKESYDPAGMEYSMFETPFSELTRPKPHTSKGKINCENDD